MDRIWQWAWDRYAARYSWAIYAVSVSEALLPTVRVPTLVVHHADDPVIPPELGRYVADHISGAKYVELPGRNIFHVVEPWRPSFQEIAQFLTGQQAEMPDDRVLATVLFTDIVDSTRRAAEIGDRDWHALLDAAPTYTTNRGSSPSHLVMDEA